MDKKLGFSIDYLDYEIDNFRKKIYSKPVTEQLKLLNEFLHDVKNDFTRNIGFAGYHEMKRFIDKMLFEVLNVNYKEYNLKYIKDDSMKLYTCFKIEDGSDSYFCLFDDNGQLNLVDKNVILEMLNNGWVTKSESLIEDINNKVI